MADSQRSGALDSVARDLAAGEISRRSALKRFAGASLAAVLAGGGALIAPGTAEASCPPRRKCGSKCCPPHSHCTPKGRCRCNSGYTKCNGKCVDLQKSVNNCGACGQACDTLNSLGAACVGGGCTYTGCASGYLDCNTTSPDLDGCETHVAGDPSNCGACGQTCDTVHSLGAACVGGGCTYTGCVSGYTDCNTTSPDLDGCETHVAGDPSNCGACGQTCDTVHSLGAACVAGGCTYTGCAAGYLNCNSSPPDLNGCETQESVNNCGACGQACDTVHSLGAACVSGGCTYTGCAAGYVDCDQSGANTNGCECQGTGCCGSGCQTKHSNGVGQFFFDCTALATYNQTQAFEACTAFTGDASKCHAFTCTGGGSNSVVCSDGAATCDCWNYTGTNVGHVNASGTTTCSCPTTGDPTWN